MTDVFDFIFFIRLIMKKISKEFEEVMFTKTEGKLIEQLTVCCWGFFFFFFFFIK